MRKILSVFLAVLMCASLGIALDQPNMTAARNDLNQAEKSLRKATAGKGGHRERAIDLINQAVAEVNRGIEFDRMHNTPGRRGRRNSDFSQNDFNAVSTAVDQPHMQAAREHLKEALNHLQRASADKGGHRARAINFVRSAIDEVNKGIAFDRSN